MAWRGMITDAMLAITQKHVPIVFTFFEDTGKEVNSFLQERGVPYFEVNVNSMGDAVHQEQVVFVCSASMIQSPSGINFIKAISARAKVSFLFAGHYPLPKKEDATLFKLTTDFPGTPIIFYFSLDDPSFEMFNADRIVSILEQLGLKEDEMLEHKMITTSMRRAREKIEEGVKNEVTTSSEAEWFLKNVKK